MNIGNRRAFAAQARQDYEKETVAAAGGGGGQFDNAGPPTWDRTAWDAFKAKYGEYPYKATGPFPPTMVGAPDFVYQYMGLRRPPVGVTLGSGSIS